MKLSTLNREVTRVFENNHTRVGPLDTETTFDMATGTVMCFTTTINLTQEQCFLLCDGNWSNFTKAVEDEFDRYMNYEEGEGSYGDSEGTQRPMQIDGLDLFIGDGDDSLAVQFLDCHRTVRIWVRAWPLGM